MDAGGLTLQDLIKRRQAGGFIGRRHEIGQFEENLRLPLEDRRRRFLFSVHGDAGVGKSFLVNQFQRIAGEQGCATAYVDESVFDIPAVMAGIVRSFARQGDPCKDFTRKSELYHEKRHELDADPATPDGLSSVLTRSAVRIGLRAAEDIPVVGSFAKELDREALSNQVEKFRAFLSVKLRNQHDVRLLMSPVEELTPVFVSELHAVAAKRPVVLFFDTFERTGSFLERWLLDLLGGRYGGLPANLLLVVAGQHPLDVNAWGDYLGIRADLALTVFTEVEAREFLAARGLTATDVVEVVLALSGRLPVLLALLAESRPDSAASVADPGDNAVERFLKWEKDEKRKLAALRGALPRQLDRDVFALVADSTTPDEDFGWLRRLPFVTERATGYRYHDVVRDTMIRVVRRRSSVEWRERHGALAEYYRAAREALGLDEETGWPDERWQALAVEEHYHRLCATAATADTLTALVETVTARADQSGRWVAMVVQAGADSGAEQMVALGARLSASEDPVALITCLTIESAMSDEVRLLAYRELARQHLRKPDFVAAAAAFTAILEREPDDGWALASRGVSFRITGKLEESLADLTRAVELDPESAWEIGERGRTLQALKRSKEALVDFDRALELEPAGTDVHTARGETHYAMHRYQEALADFTRALELEPEDTGVLCWRGRAHLEGESYADALADFTRVIELEPEADWALGDRGETYRRMGRYEDALADFDRAIEMDPDYTWAFGHRARTYEDLGRREEALADYARALETDPEAVWILGRRGVAHRESGRYGEALADFARALEIKPDADWIFGFRGETHLAMRQFEQARADFTRAIEIDPEYLWALDKRALTHRAMGDHSGALADFARALEIDPEAAWVLGDRAQTHQLAGRTAEALADYDRAIALDPEYAWAVRERALALCGLERHADAFADLTRTIEADPAAAWRWSTRGEIQYAVGLYEDAVADFTRAVELDAEFARARCFRGRTWLSLKQYDDAFADVDGALAVNPVSAWALSLRGQLHRMHGRFAEALPDLEHSAELDAEGWDHYQLGLLAHAQGRPDTADERVRTAIRVEKSEIAGGDSSSGSALLNLVIYHLALGEPDEARGRLRTALAADPLARYLREALEDLEDLGSVMTVPELPEFTAALRAKLNE
ncbi:tetratricopeptide repeat protein [Amycolatopsis sp. NPDC088138]|uniref:tetratricopeptide repeat protein n=1 Tax=Amycolatopsis sp. NPDC088138 TaxID=3363938 RepID=UPI003827FD13